ncbi:MAG TPA: sugar transferase [Vicinamibacterales bacterium]|nr:sugar transferase [Vicinamibacterales bacterium]
MTPTLKFSLTFARRAFDAACGLCLLLMVFTVGTAVHSPYGWQELFSVRLTVKNLVLLCAFLGVWNGALALVQPPQLRTRKESLRQVLGLCRAVSIGTLPVLLFCLTSESGEFTGSMVVLFWVLAVVTEVAGHIAMTLVARWVARAGAPIKVLVVGSGPRTLRLLANIGRDNLLRYDILGFLDRRDAGRVQPHIARRLLGPIEDLERFLAQNAVDLVLVALPVRSCYELIQHVLATCERMGVEVQYPSDVFALGRAKVSHDRWSGIPATRVTHVVDDYRLVVKRGLDIAGAVAGLLIVSPLLLVTAVLVRATSPGPAIFSQLRYGFNRRQFRMYKFRTMVVDAEAQQAKLEHRNEVEGPAFKIRNDPRITTVGRFLRKTSIDELPQLFNVLLGDMSLVGPRPLPLRDVGRFNESSLMRRFSVKPGLTCLWQVNGRSDTNFGKWIELDLQYIDRWSLGLDLAILARTIPAVLRGSGAA